MGAEEDEGEVTRKAIVVVVTITGYLALLVSIMWMRSTPASPSVSKIVPAVPDESQITSAVQQGVKESRMAIQKVKDVVPDVICHQVPVGETIIVKLVAGRDYYDPGKFKIVDAPRVADLALGVANVYNAFVNVRSNQFEVDFRATGTADAIPVQGGIDYDGQAQSCLVEGEYLTLNSGPKALDNKLLACARAAALAQYLQNEKMVLPIKIELKGQEYGEEGGRFRSVDVEITFIGLLRYAPDADFCG